MWQYAAMATVAVGARLPKAEESNEAGGGRVCVCELLCRDARWVGWEIESNRFSSSSSGERALSPIATGGHVCAQLPGKSCPKKNSREKVVDVWWDSFFPLFLRQVEVIFSI